MPAGARVDRTICLTDFFDTCADVIQRRLPDAAAEVSIDADDNETLGTAACAASPATGAAGA